MNKKPKVKTKNKTKTKKHRIITSKPREIETTSYLEVLDALKNNKDGTFIVGLFDKYWE